MSLSFVFLNTIHLYSQTLLSLDLVYGNQNSDPSSVPDLTFDFGLPGTLHVIQSLPNFLPLPLNVLRLPLLWYQYITTFQNVLIVDVITPFIFYMISLRY